MPPPHPTHHPYLPPPPYWRSYLGPACVGSRVESESEYERVSGTALGGGTFLGLCRLLTQAKTFAEALDLAAAGDSRSVDMLVQERRPEAAPKPPIPPSF